MSEGTNNSRDSALQQRSEHELLELKFELDECCQSESLSEEGLREIIERHGLTPNHYDSDVGDNKFFYEACRNERVNEGIIRYLLEYFPDAASVTVDGDGWLSLHAACDNKNVTKGIIEILIEASPDSVRSVDFFDDMPLHNLCDNRNLDETAAIEILELLLEKHPEAVRHVDSYGVLPIHIAACELKSPEFCRVLIEAYPGSERITDDKDALPLHYACFSRNFGTVKYLYNLFPNAIHHARRTDGFYPIHTAINGASKIDDNLNIAHAAAEIVTFLLDCDPSVKLQRCKGKSLLDYACDPELHDHAALAVIEVIYDAHPEAIEDNGIADVQDYHLHVQAFIDRELVYARQAKDHRMITTPDENGQLPLHKALQNNARLGSVKLLMKGNPNALQSADNRGRLPFHVACQHHDSATMIEYLVGLDPSTLDAVDRDGDTVLHLACHYARYDITSLLLDEFDAVSVSKRNAGEKLPIDLLWDSNEVEDRKGIEYTESVYRLIRANPERIMDISVQTMQSSASASLPCENGKKRKLGQ